MQINHVNNNIHFKGLAISVKTKKNISTGTVTLLEENIKRCFLKNGKEIGTHIFDENEIYIEKQGKKFTVTVEFMAQNRFNVYCAQFSRVKNEQFNKFAKRVIKTLDRLLPIEKNKYQLSVGPCLAKYSQ